MTRRIASGLVAVVAVAAVAATFAVVDSETEVPGGGYTNSPRPIAGGRFEASGVAHVPGGNQLLFVDDGQRRKIFLLELARDATQKGTALPVPLEADVTDPEGITFDGTYFYIVGSQSKKTGFKGDGLVRFRFDTVSRRAIGIQRVQGLKAWLGANVPELRGIEGRVADDVLNIEGLAWDPNGRRLLLGLRAPVVDGQALVVPIALSDSTAPLTRENLRVDGPTQRLPLNGDGIRGMEYDANRAAFQIIAGASLDAGHRAFRVLEWNGRAGPLREVASYSRGLKPEGITPMMLGERPVTVIVFDVGSYLVTN